MLPLIANGQVWKVILVNPNDPRLIDRTGTLRLATTDPATKTVSISAELSPPMLDKVLLHEAAHVMTMAYGLLDQLRSFLPEELWVPVEEWSARLLEDYGVESTLISSEALGRPLCVRGYCVSAK